jgi:hypothetical protein
VITSKGNSVPAPEDLGAVKKLESFSSLHKEFEFYVFAKRDVRRAVF